MGILSTAAGGIPADSHLVGDQRAETVHARTTAGSIDCRIRKRAQAWTGERLEQEIGLCRKLSNGIDDHFAKSAAWLRRTAGRARSLNVASKAAPTSFSKSLRPTWSLGSTKSNLPSGFSASCISAKSATAFGTSWTIQNARTKSTWAESPMCSRP